MLFVFSLKSKVLAALDTSILAQREFLSHSEQGMAMQVVLFMYFFYCSCFFKQRVDENYFCYLVLLTLT